MRDARRAGVAHQDQRRPALLAKPAKKRAAPRDGDGGGSTFRPQQGPMLPGATRRAGQKRLRSAPELLANLPAATRATDPG